MKITYGILLSVLAAAAGFVTARAQDSADNSGTVVFRYDGTEDYNVCYRIPTITTIENGTHKGRVLAISDYRYCGKDIGNGRIDLYMSYSDDNGVTWSAPDHLRNAAGQPVAQGTGKGTVATSLENPDCGFGDAAMVCDRESGKVLLVSVCGRTPFFSARRENPNQVARWYSEDGGDTWTEFTNITDRMYKLFDGTVPNRFVDGIFFGSGRLVQSRYIKVGDYYRVYGVVSGNHAGTGTLSNWVLYTDDFGETWHILGDPMNPPVATKGDEPKAEELPDGSVILAARRNGGNRHFNIFRYTDVEANEGYWGNLNATNMGMGAINACNGEIMILPVRSVSTGKQSYMALQSFPYGGKRSNVSIAWKAIGQGADFASPDAFSEWNGRIQLTDLGSCYSTMCLQHDNTIGFLYEEETFGKQYTQIYRNLTIQEITGGEYEYYPDSDGSVAAGLRADVVDYRLEDAKGVYVGQPEGSPDAGKAASDYHAAPSDANYYLFNKALTSSDKIISIVDGGVYSLKSAHDGLYSFGDRWLMSDGVTLKSASTQTDESLFTFIYRADTNDWLMYHPATRTFVGRSPATSETEFQMTANPDEAHGYETESNIYGYTNLCDTDPGMLRYCAIHQSGNNGGRVVAWMPAEQASQWYLKLEHLASADEMPELKSGIEDILQDADASIRYYDITGREVTAPQRGQLLITSDHRKIIY
ncbi:MAG: glycoside hydrolase [Duncaniella sp.]|nr:glycoside hydrolase [Duncaniella sp.]